MIIAALLPILLTMAPSAAQAVDPGPITRAVPQLHTPGAIAPAVLPYLACPYASRVLPLLRGSDRSQIAYAKSDSNCSAARVRARADARKMLHHATMPAGTSADRYIEDALSEMDACGGAAGAPRTRDRGWAIGGGRVGDDRGRSPAGLQSL